MKDHVRARDVTCRTPNCPRPAARCDQDHLIPYPAGTTSEDNLCSACRRHHRLKHEGRWNHRLSDDPNHPPGTVVITSPTGHVYLSHQPTIGRTNDDDQVTKNPSAEEAAPAATIRTSDAAPDRGEPPF